ncbi:unnamed protein product [Dovyalis caffra]|uniref:Uncharacterized protein n=1 Tax=Dovyalis caffra TaxID=77055 RepID=A0AAV1SD21_9ROSI|nr:unnamed protein product [Dovyalis caffra]
MVEFLLLRGEGYLSSYSHPIPPPPSTNWFAICILEHKWLLVISFACMLEDRNHQDLSLHVNIYVLLFLTAIVIYLKVVVYEGAIREKPSSKEEAREFLKGYSGGHAATVGSVLVTNLKTGFRKGEWDRVEIYFHEIPDEVTEKLIEEGIVLRVAGGLIIEHPLVGTTDSVMGLPKALTKKLIEEAL